MELLLLGVMLKQIKKFCAGSLVAAAILTSFSSTGQAALIVSNSVDNEIWDEYQIIFGDNGVTWEVRSNPTSSFSSVNGAQFARSTFEGDPYGGLSSAVYLLLGSEDSRTFLNGAVEGSDNWVHFLSAAGNSGWIQLDLSPNGLTDSSVLRYVYDDAGENVSLQDAIAAIPEPSSVVYLGLLGGGLFLWALSRQRKAKTVA